MDFQRYCFDVPDITRFALNNRTVRPETAAEQARLLRHWEGRREEYHLRTKWDPERLASWQLERVSLLVDFAFCYSPFYRELYSGVGFKPGDILEWQDYHRLPIVTKQDLVQRFDDIVIEEFRDDTRYHSSRTSGSSGLALRVVRDEAAQEFRAVCRLRQYELMLGRDLRPKDWRYMIYIAPSRYSSLAGRYPVFTISQECPPEPILEHISRLRPRIVSVLPSYLQRMVARDATPLRKHGVELVTTSSEPSSRAERDRWSEALGVPVLDEYSTEELSIIATECCFGRYHLTEDNVRIDGYPVEYDATAAGQRLVGTSLVCNYMPIIRYEQGDLVTLDRNQEPCGCGNRFAYFSAFSGRKDQALSSRVKGPVPSYLVMSLYDRTLLARDAGIKEFQVVQKGLGTVELRVVPKHSSGWHDDTRIKEFCEGLKTLFDDEALEIDVKLLDVLPKGRSYKRRLIVNEMMS